MVEAIDPHHGKPVRSLVPEGMVEVIVEVEVTGH